MESTCRGGCSYKKYTPCGWVSAADNGRDASGDANKKSRGCSERIRKPGSCRLYQITERSLKGTCHAAMQRYMIARDACIDYKNIPGNKYVHMGVYWAVAWLRLFVTQFRTNATFCCAGFRVFATPSERCTVKPSLTRSQASRWVFRWKQKCRSTAVILHRTIYSIGLRPIYKTRMPENETRLTLRTEKYALDIICYIHSQCDTVHEPFLLLCFSYALSLAA